LRRLVCMAAAVLMLGWTATASARATRAEAIIRHVFGARAHVALCVARHESRLHVRAINRNADGSIDRGLFQINSVHRGWVNLGRLFDPWYNARIAYRLSRGGRDWRPWSVYAVQGFCH